MSKRRAGDDLPASKASRGGNDRAEKLAVCLGGLNAQFASWVATHKEANLYKFWVEGVRDYLTHASKLLDEYSDILGDGAAALKKTATAAEETLASTSGRPAAGGFGSGAIGGLFGAPVVQPSPAAPAPATGFMAPASASASAPASVAASAPAASAPSFAFGAAAPVQPAAAPAAAAPAAFSFGAPAAVAAKPAEAKDGADGSKDAAAAAGSDKAGTKPAAAAPAPFSFGAPSTSTAAAGDSAAAPKAFSFGASATGAGAGAGGKEAGKDDASAAGAAKAAPALFSFGAAPAAASAPAAAAASSSASGAATLAGSIFGSTSGSAAGSAPAFSFGVAPATTAAGDKKDDAAAGGGAAAAASAPAPAFGFFGAAGSAPAAGSSAGFSFGSSAPPFGGAAGFSFGAAPAAAAAGGDGGQGDGDDDGEAEAEQDECAKEPSLVVDDSAVEFLFKAKARLHVPKPADQGPGFEARGTGTLSVRRAKTEGAKPYVALFTDTGRCLYQAYFNKTMKLIVSDKQKSISFAAAWSPDGVSPPAVKPALFQLAAGKNRELETTIKKLQDEMPE